MNTYDRAVMAIIAVFTGVSAIGLLSIAYSVLDVRQYGLPIINHQPPPEQEVAEEEALDEYVEDHRPDAGLYDGGPLRVYPDGGMPAEVYVEQCRMLCESPRNEPHVYGDEPVPGTPHVIEVNPTTDRCVCWRPDVPYWNHIEVYTGWARR